MSSQTPKENTDLSDDGNKQKSEEAPIAQEQQEEFEDFGEDDFNDDADFEDDADFDEKDGSDGWGAEEELDSQLIPKALPQMEKQVSVVTALTPADIKVHIQKMIAALAENLALDNKKCLLLLRRYKWNSGKIIELFFANPEKTQIDAGICMKPVTEDDMKQKTAKIAEIECGICMDDVKVSQTFNLSCGHLNTCKACWLDYLLNKVKGKDCIHLPCPTHKCKVIIESDVWKLFLSQKHSTEYERYFRFCDDNFVEHSKEFVFCPGKSCDMIYSAEVGVAKEICCLECAYRFCYACKYDSHLPASCNVAELWLNKCSSEAETISWVLAKCKKCPKCRMPIEKNQGCNHMTCRGAYGCGHEFCWLCKGDWKEHGSGTGGYYKCNIYEKNVKDGTVADEEAKQKDAVSELERYEFHYTRFDSHCNSCIHAIKQKETMDTKMMELAQKFGWRLNEANFLLDACKEVIKCWHVLSWTYPIAYYLQEQKKKDVLEFVLPLFQEHQAKLEFFCDGLQEKLDFDFEKLGDIKTRRAVIEFTRTAQQFRTNIEEAIDSNISI